jgi:hypothetical protein
MGEGRGMYRVLMGKLDGMRPMGRPKCRWENNIKADLQEVGCRGGRALVNAVMNLRVT